MKIEDKLVVAAWIWTVPYVAIATFNPFWALIFYLPVLAYFAWAFIEYSKEATPFQF